MKVLITGGYGFIGSHVAQTFFEKGYEVHILDNLLTGNENNVQIPHICHMYSIIDTSCRFIFEEHQFQYIIHLAAQVSVANSISHPIHDANQNINGLLNILLLAKEFNVKKFIFASSAAVYGNNNNLPLSEMEAPAPISPYGISKYSGELYCRNILSNSACLRFSNVYGPRQTNHGEGGVISIFTDLALQQRTLFIHGDGQQTRDFIYVGDIANAIYNAAISNTVGIFNVSTNTSTSINTIVDILCQIHGKIDTQYRKSRIGDIAHSSLNNASFIKESNWLPTMSLIDGLNATYNWASTQKLHSIL